MKPTLSSHIEFDDPRYWQFQRSSGLPWGYFDRTKITPDAIVVVVSLVCLAIALAVAA